MSKQRCSGSGAEHVQHTTRLESISNGIIYILFNAFRKSGLFRCQNRNCGVLLGKCCFRCFNNSVGNRCVLKRSALNTTDCCPSPVDFSTNRPLSRTAAITASRISSESLIAVAVGLMPTQEVAKWTVPLMLTSAAPDRSLLKVASF